MKISKIFLTIGIFILVFISCNNSTSENSKEAKYRLVYDSVFIWEKRQWAPMQLMTTTYNSDNQIEKVTEHCFLINDRTLYKRVQELRASYYYRHKILTQKPVPPEGCWSIAQYTDYIYNDDGLLIEKIDGFYEADELTNYFKSVAYQYNSSDKPSIIQARQKRHPDSTWTITSHDSIIYNDLGLKAEKYNFRNRPTPSYWYSYRYDSITANEIIKRRFNSYTNSWDTFELVKESFDVQGHIFQISSGTGTSDDFVVNQSIDRWFTFNDRLSYELTNKVSSDSTFSTEPQSNIEYEYDEIGNLISKTYANRVNGLWVKLLQERFSYEEYSN